ncbi:hypothetical protein Afil01_28100 [Actinorhabdospora filicis]|uniref:Uncharacterized protein n=1 Tax=Actinorhabdospora filicis TaxID=1785913 RepID=A0A9W6SKN8_9ACTN|nr:hypothetical protein [Actinorhabdospora filicis]GLZ78003.1 hypothetical protein Afil01_28100 [Actinorhabdospora filicis]
MISICALAVADEGPVEWAPEEPAAGGVLGRVLGRIGCVLILLLPLTVLGLAAYGAYVLLRPS